jgi:hypothetical protein
MARRMTADHLVSGRIELVPHRAHSPRPRGMAQRRVEKQLNKVRHRKDPEVATPIILARAVSFRVDDLCEYFARFSFPRFGGEGSSTETVISGSASRRKMVSIEEKWCRSKRKLVSDERKKKHGARPEKHGVHRRKMASDSNSAAVALTMQLARGIVLADSKQPVSSVGRLAQPVVRRAIRVRHFVGWVSAAQPAVGLSFRTCQKSVERGL